MLVLYALRRAMTPTLLRDDMHYWLLKPAPALRPWVVCYFVVRPSPAPFATGGKPELFLPDGLSELVFAIGAEFARWKVGDIQQPTHMRSSYAIGGRSHSVMTSADSANEVIGVKLHPRLLRCLIQTGLSEFRDAPVHLRDIGIRSLLDLEDELAGLRDVGAIKRTLDKFLTNCSRCLDADTIVDAFVESVSKERGGVAIMQWVAGHRLDSRTFERRFCNAMGMTPKQYARVIRFRTAYQELISAGKRANRHLDGYYDQSHFHREFKYFTGVAPAMKIQGRFDRQTSISDHLLQGEPDARSGYSSEQPLSQRPHGGHDKRSTERPAKAVDLEMIR
jgi:AraC-like DNA-binding protein